MSASVNRALPPRMRGVPPAARKDARRLADYELVVVGASAGGVEAVGRLLSALPENFAPAMAVVLHLPPGRPSLLASILADRCARPVREVSDKAPMEPGTVHVAPADYHLLLERDRRFALSMDEPVNWSRPSIDVLFESAAWALGPRVLGVVLTGASDDGAAGLAAIRAAGGGAWVQAPDTAQMDTMPRAALARAGADRVLTLERMMEGLTRMTTDRVRRAIENEGA